MNRGFYDWALRNQLYYGEVLNKEASSKLDKILCKAPLEVKRSIIDVFRGVQAVVRPDRLALDHFYFQQQHQELDGFCFHFDQELMVLSWNSSRFRLMNYSTDFIVVIE